MYLKILKFFKL